MPDFAALVDEFLAEEFDRSPVYASALGLTEYDDRLDDLSAEAFDKARRRRREVARSLRATSPTTTSTPTTDRPRSGHLRPARPADPGRLEGLEARPADLQLAIHQRHLHPLPSPPAARTGAGRGDLARLEQTPTRARAGQGQSRRQRWPTR